MKTLKTAIIAAFLLIPAVALAQPSYDGLWFLGFNTNKDIFGDSNGKAVRIAINKAVNRSYICKKMIGDNNVPKGVMPKGEEGYDDTVKGFNFDPKGAKEILFNVGYKEKDKRLQNLILLHTDGVKTRAVANEIVKDLKAVGITVKTKEVPYDNTAAWEDMLFSGKHHLFLMGYKYMSLEDNSTLITSSFDPVQYIRNLFASDGNANVFFLKDKKLDQTLDYVELIPSTEAVYRVKKLKALNRRLQEDPVTVNLFYIKRL